MRCPRRGQAEQWATRFALSSNAAVVIGKSISFFAKLARQAP
ncbi:Hypothetical Protein RSKD131_1299 [Cereibacter sphaeroides KD131]|nr:Hypothetical Protein RSKD131_1299 [Cereibacter sphaeroides KD131]